jgi:trigger factor
VTPEQYVQHMVEHNHLPELMAEIRRAKALAQVVENAVVTDASGERVELRRLLPDGTYADEADDAGTDDEPTPAVDAAAAVIGSTDFLVEAETPADQ